MTKIYETTKRIHKLIEKINEKYGLNIVIDSNSVIYIDDNELIETAVGYCENYISDTGELMTIDARNYIATMIGLSREFSIARHSIATTITAEWQFAIKAPQIRNILLSLSDTLGENYFNQETANEEAKQQNYFSSAELSDAYERGYYSCLLNFHHKTIAEALCQKWLDGLNPLIDQEPEQVLSELLEVLEVSEKLV